MLTLKIISTDIDGNQFTHLLSGDAITHREYFSSDHCIMRNTNERSPMVRIVGTLTETSSTQKFVVSDVIIYEDDHALKNQLLILPKADCYIMEAGKTVDSFYCGFESKE
jgi:hypothetical protein